MAFTKDILISLAEKIKQRNKLPGAEWVQEHGESLRIAIAAHLIRSVEQNPDIRIVEFSLVPHNHGIEDGLTIYQIQFLIEQFPDISIRSNYNKTNIGLVISW